MDTIGHHLEDEFIKMLLVPRLAPRGQAQIIYKTLHKGWSMPWCSFLYATKCESERKREADMAAIEGYNSFDEQIRLKRDPLPLESTYHKFMVVLTYYTVLTLTVWQ